eukprot:Seg552.2 transcript_id=Seg552.2/GoldUCD/mRNA.D3Y31 product="hypothetical protein" protein_id=Seg552.2/GoldUCD/D3Y31
MNCAAYLAALCLFVAGMQSTFSMKAPESKASELQEETYTDSSGSGKEYFSAAGLDENEPWDGGENEQQQTKFKIPRKSQHRKESKKNEGELERRPFARSEPQLCAKVDSKGRCLNWCPWDTCFRDVKNKRKAKKGSKEH